MLWKSSWLQVFMKMCIGKFGIQKAKNWWLPQCIVRNKQWACMVISSTHIALWLDFRFWISMISEYQSPGWGGVNSYYNSKPLNRVVRSQEQSVAQPHIEQFVEPLYSYYGSVVVPASFSPYTSCTDVVWKIKHIHSFLYGSGSGKAFRVILIFSTLRMLS